MNIVRKTTEMYKSFKTESPGSLKYHLTIVSYTAYNVFYEV